MNGDINSSPSSVLILTNENDVDIVQFIINGAYQEIGVESYMSFASHILIDATIGVYKNMDSVDWDKGIQELTVHQVFSNNQMTLIDNQGIEMPMIDGTYQHEENLNIVISMNTGE